jgi:propionyl-CoA carboxylase alpha chain
VEGSPAGVVRSFEVYVDADREDVESSLGHVALRRLPRFTDPADRVAGGSLLAPMPGTVVSIDVAPGDRVGVGRPVLVIEAMKMQHTVTAPHDGVVSEVPVTVGQQVAAGAVLCVVQAESADSGDGADVVSRRSQARSSTTVDQRLGTTPDEGDLS